MNNNDTKSGDKTSGNSSKNCYKYQSGDIYWWSSLVVAVLAVPSIGFVIASVVPGRELGQIVVFMLTCWLCTFFGMRLMKK